MFIRLLQGIGQLVEDFGRRKAQLVFIHIQVNSLMSFERIKVFMRNFAYCNFLVTHGGGNRCVGIGYDIGDCFSVYGMYMCECPRCKRKTTWAINTKLGRRTVHGNRSACIDYVIKRSKIKVSQSCMSIWLLRFLVCPIFGYAYWWSKLTIKLDRQLRSHSGGFATRWLLIQVVRIIFTCVRLSWQYNLTRVIRRKLGGESEKVVRMFARRWKMETGQKIYSDRRKNFPKSAQFTTDRLTVSLVN